MRSGRLSALSLLDFDPRGRRGAGIADRATKPNIILCMTDDQGWGDVSYNGLKQIQTPNLDAMAAAGLRFDRFYAAHPSCSPTRASVMTGRHPEPHGRLLAGHAAAHAGNDHRPGREDAPAIATGHFGKWHLNGVAGTGQARSRDSDPLHPGHFGFDEWFSVSNYFDTDWTFSRNGEPGKGHRRRLGRDRRARP